MLPRKKMPQEMSLPNPECHIWGIYINNSGPPRDLLWSVGDTYEAYINNSRARLPAICFGALETEITKKLLLKSLCRRS